MSAIRIITSTSQRNFVGALNKVMPEGSHLVPIKVELVKRGDAIYVTDIVEDRVITNSVELLKKVTGDTKASLVNYRGSIIPFKGKEFLILDNFQPLVYNAKEQFSVAMFLLKFFNPSIYSTRECEKHHHHIVEALPSQKAEVIKLMEESTFCAMDIETSKKSLGITLIGYTFVQGTVVGETYVLEFNQANYKLIQEINLSMTPKCFHNGQYDCAYLSRWGVSVNAWSLDTQYLWHSMFHELKKSLAFVASHTVRDVRYWKDGRKATSWEDYVTYNAQDCIYTAHAMVFMLGHFPQWSFANYKVTHQLDFYAWKMGLRGMWVDLPLYNEIQSNYIAIVEKEESKLQACLGQPEFNVASPKQSKRLLEILTNKSCKVTASDASMQEKVSFTSPFARFIIEQFSKVRKLRKILSTYTRYEILGGKLLYSLNPSGTTSDRFASKAHHFWCGAQIQNFPARGDGKIVRKAIIASKGFVLGSKDMPQSESRCTAYLAQEPALIEAVESDKDFHRVNASAFFGVPYDEIDTDLRNLAKRVNHGANYNMGAFILLDTMGQLNVAKAQKLLGLPSSLSLIQVCDALLLAFQKAYPRLKGDSTPLSFSKSWYQELKHEVKTQGKIRTPDGWTRIIFGDVEQKNVLNNLVSAKPQHLSVAIINKGLVKAFQQLEGEDFRILAQIHDEIMYEVRVGKEEEYDTRLGELMTIPMTVEGVEMVIVPDPATHADNWMGIH